MNISGKHLVAKRVIVYEKVAFVSIILLIWFDEVIDIPDLLLGAEPTPFFSLIGFISGFQGGFPLSWG